MSIKIVEDQDKFHIVGDKEGLRTLGEALILKSKMGDDFVCTIKNKDGDGSKPIELDLKYV